MGPVPLPPNPGAPQDPLLSATRDVDTARNKCGRPWDGRRSCLVAAAQQDVKEWSHEFVEIARHRRAALRRAVCHFGAGRPPPTDEEISEEIVVTAQKRATALQDVPFSIAAVTNEDLEQSGATNIVDVARNVPGLYITDLGPGPEPGRDPRHQRRPGRARSAGREGIRRHLPRRVADLGRAVHAGPRSLRPGSHRSAARTAGHAVRRRQSMRARCVTSPRSPTSARSADRSILTLNTLTDGEFGGSLRGAHQRAHRRNRGDARGGLLQRAAGLHRLAVSRP